ncbi:MAG TPA: DUF6541 family protein [Rugosimonospora sp.]|nr:DUF6541 family protein [Rugosimonospora sp.]
MSAIAPAADEVSAPPAAEPAEPAPARRWRTDLVVYAAFVLLAIFLLRHLWRDPAGVVPDENQSDPMFFEFALNHAVRIFTHGENPLFSPQVNAPLGVSMVANTGALGLTVPLVPVTALFGAPVALLVMLTLGIAATAGAWYHVLSRHVVTSRTAAIVGGAFCGFAPGIVNHLNMHPNLVAQFLIPFILWRALELRNPGPVLRRGVILGLLVVWQAFLNEELLFLYALAALVFVAVYGLFRPQVVRAGARPMLRGLTVAAVIAGILLVYPLWYQFLGPQHYKGLPGWVLDYGTDAAEYYSFAKLSLVHGDGSLGRLPEQNTFFGWPLLLLLVAGTVWLWRRVEVRALAVVALVFGVLSLGRVAEWDHHKVLRRAPWELVNGLPLFDSVVPVRLGLIVVPILGILLALLLAHALSRPAPVSHAWVAAFAVALVVIFPQSLPVVPRTPVPYFFTSGDWRGYVPDGASVVNADTTVWNGGINAMAWTNEQKLAFRVTGGYFLGPHQGDAGEYGTVNRPTAQILYDIVYGAAPPAQVTPEQRAQAVEDIRFWRAAVIVLAPGTSHHDELAAALTQLVGPGQEVDDVLLWDVRSISGV